MRLPGFSCLDTVFKWVWLKAIPWQDPVGLMHLRMNMSLPRLAQGSSIRTSGSIRVLFNMCEDKEKLRPFGSS